MNTIMAASEIFICLKQYKTFAVGGAQILLVDKSDKSDICVAEQKDPSKVQNPVPLEGLSTERCMM